jgi:hypothetical protein
LVYTEAALQVVVPQRAPQSGCLHQQLERDVALEVDVAGGGHMADRSVGDIGVDVEGRGTSRPVSRAFLASDSAPRKRRTSQPELRGTLKGEREDLLPPTQHIGGRVRHGVAEHRQHEGFGVPKGMAVIPRAGEALGRDSPLLSSRPCLQNVKRREPDRLL